MFQLCFTVLMTCCLQQNICSISLVYHSNISRAYEKDTEALKRSNYVTYASSYIVLDKILKQLSNFSSKNVCTRVCDKSNNKEIPLLKYQ